MEKKLDRRGGSNYIAVREAPLDIEHEFKLAYRRWISELRLYELDIAWNVRNYKKVRGAWDEYCQWRDAWVSG